MKKLRARFKLWLSTKDVEGVFGDGKWRLLKSIDAEVEITQFGKECHSGCAIFQQIGDCVMPREGVFAKVIKPGRVKPGDAIYIYHPQAALEAATHPERIK